MSQAVGPVRPARAEERAVLGELLAGLLAHHGDHPRYAAAAAGGTPASLLADYLGHPDGQVFVAERDGQPVGLISVALARRPAFFAESLRGHVEHLYVAPEARRGGLGRELVEAAFGWLRLAGATRVELEVARDNPEGQAFWKALGFGPVTDVLERPL
ncbi:MAG: GNAT family N-acetyltransferase [Deltaproteobacteria bacterium]|nr:GNAT family N-acetyltransferase [Deltaproteobacteria bacterium]MBW2394386.1 GNAT family N-acetyltransferase [Deltaproteobacteria bacterium]